MFEAAKGVDDKTMGIQYLETLKTDSESPSTKWIITMEFTQLVSPFVQKLKDSSEAK